MLKKVLLASAASAVLAISAQGVATPVYAQANIKPKIKVAPPKARIRVVKPRIRIRVDTKRLAKKKQNGANGDQSAQTVSSRTTPQATQTASLPKPNLDLTNALPGADKAGELAQIKELREAVEQSKNIARLAVEGVSLGLSDPLNPDDDQAANPADGETPQAGGSGLTPPGSDQLGNPLAGAGVDHAVFGFLTNSHGSGYANANRSGDTADAAKNALGVTAASIARGVAGLSGRGTTVHQDNILSQEARTSGPAQHTLIVRSENADGTKSTIITVTDVTTGITDTTTVTDSADGSVVVTESTAVDVESADGDGNSVLVDTYYTDRVYSSDNPTPSEVSGSYTTVVTELRDPDSAEGGNHPFHWLEKPQATIQDKVAGIGPGGLPPAPGESQPSNASGGASIISQHDLVSNYDPDAASDKGQLTPIPVCFGSEC